VCTGNEIWRPKATAELIKYLNYRGNDKLFLEVEKNGNISMHFHLDDQWNY
jgi:hypothetical protein